MNKCMIKHKFSVWYASFEERCAHTRIISYTPLNMIGNHFLVYGTDKGCTSVSMHYSIFFKYVVIFLRVIHLTLHFFTETHV